MNSKSYPRSFLLATVSAILGFSTVFAQPLAPADGPFIIDSWLEEPHLRLSYIWNLYERRDGSYQNDWSEAKLAAVDTWQFGMREALKAMAVSSRIATHHDGDAWIQLYNVATNAPNGQDTDYPPHINVISYWGSAGTDYQGDVNAHFYPTAQGAIDPQKTWYGWRTEPACPPGIRNPSVGQWMPHLDRQCRTLFEERVTADGDLQLRLAQGHPVYTLRNHAPSNPTPSNLDIWRDELHIINLQRVFHNAWINYPDPYPDGIAKVVWEIRYFEHNRLLTETITANPHSGQILSHQREESPLAGDPQPLFLPLLRR